MWLHRHICREPQPGLTAACYSHNLYTLDLFCGTFIFHFFHVSQHSSSGIICIPEHDFSMTQYQQYIFFFCKTKKCCFSTVNERNRLPQLFGAGKKEFSNIVENKTRRFLSFNHLSITLVSEWHKGGLTLV